MILETGCQQNVAANIKFDVVDSEIPLLLGKSVMEQWNLTINTCNDNVSLVVNGKLKRGRTIYLC